MKHIIKYEEFANKLKTQSAKASSDKQISLAIDVCKKLFIDYQKFSYENEWGNPQLLLDAIQLAENFQPRDEHGARELLPLIHDNCPDSEDFEGASYAINASAAVYETLEFILDRNTEHIYNIGTYLTDTIYFRIQEDVDLTEDQIDSHPLMIEARNYLIMATQ